MNPTHFRYLLSAMAVRLPIGQSPAVRRPWVVGLGLALALCLGHRVVLAQVADRPQTAPSPSATVLDSPDDEQLAQELSELATRWAEEHDYSGTWQAQRRDQVVAAGARGTVSAWSEQAIGQDTVFWTGSVSKQFAAVATLLLVERGVMSLDAPLHQYLPELQPGVLGPGNQPCTVDEILSHRCGLPRDVPGIKTHYRDHLRQPEREQALLAQVNQQPLLFEQGTDFAYSNVGYALIALAVQRAAELPYEDFLRQALWQPLGMESTGITARDGLTFAAGQTGALAGWINASDFLLFDHRRIGELGAAGNIYSTAGDLARWQNALHGGQVLQPKTYAELVRPRFADYALGIVVDEQPFGKLIHHNGALAPEGFQSLVAYLPDSGWSVTLLSNHPLGAPPLQQFAGTLLRHATGSAPPEPSDWTPRSARLINSVPLLIFSILISTALVGLSQLVRRTKPLDVVTWCSQYLSMSVLLGIPLFFFQNPNWHPMVLVWLATLLGGSVYARWWQLPAFRWSGQPLRVWLSRLMSLAIAGLLLSLAFAASRPLFWSLCAMVVAQGPIWLGYRKLHPTPPDSPGQDSTSGMAKAPEGALAD